MREILDKLGLGGIELLFHAINLVLVIVLLFFLLYKPVRQMLAERKKRAEEAYHEREKLLQETEALKKERTELREEIDALRALSKAEDEENAQKSAKNGK